MDKKVNVDFNIKAAKYMESRPKVNEVFFTSDGMIFLNDKEAGTYAAGLEDKAVVKVERAKA